MADLRPSWPDLLDPSFRKIYGDEVRQLEQKVDSIFQVETSSKNLEKYSSASGLSKLVVKDEAGPITYEDQIQGYDTTFVHKTFAKGSAVSQELWEDEQFPVMRRKPRELALARVRTREQIGADIFNYAFTAGGGGFSTFISGGDAQALIGTSHPRSDGGTAQSNYTTQDLAEDSLEIALVTMRATLDDKGQLQMVQPDVLVVPPALEKEARILLDSNQRTGTANNDINPYSGRLRLVVWDYLGSAAGGSDTAWFVLDSRMAKLLFFNRSDRGLEGPDWDFDTKVARWSVVCRWSAGFTDWRAVYGSKGDNS